MSSIKSSEKMKILCLGPNKLAARNWGHELFKREIAKQHDVCFYGVGYDNYNERKPIFKILEDFKKIGKHFDILLTYEAKWIRNFIGFNEAKIPKVHIQLDYASPKIKNFSNFSTWNNVNTILNRLQPDIIFCRTTKIVNDMKKNLNFDKIFFLPFSVDINIYKNLNLKKTIDTMAVYSDNPAVYPHRKTIKKLLTRLNIKVFTKPVKQRHYINKINESKIFVNSNNVNRSLSMKYSEVLSCGTFFLTNEPADFNLLGYENEEHLVFFTDTEDFKSKVLYYLKHETEREKIASQGMKFVRTFHNNSIRVKQFTEIVERELNL